MGVLNQFTEDDFFDVEFPVGKSSVQTADRSPAKPVAQLLVDAAPLVMNGEGRGEANEKKPVGENSKIENPKTENPKCKIHSAPDFFWKPINSEPDQIWICSSCYSPPKNLIGEKFGDASRSIASQPAAKPRVVLGEPVDARPYRNIVAMGEPVCLKCRCQWVVEQDYADGRGVILSCWTCRSLIPSDDTIWGLAERVAVAELLGDPTPPAVAIAVDITSDDLSDI